MNTTVFATKLDQITKKNESFDQEQTSCAAVVESEVGHLDISDGQVNIVLALTE